MSVCKVGDKVWFFGCECSRNLVYPEWLFLYQGSVVWISPDEEIMHVYEDGNETVTVLLDLKNFVFMTKKEAINAMISRLEELNK